ncbi:MAG TPA: lipopolysaccharide transport periplasmic protein LptA [Desulfuromonadales bacterium]|nr:lipopolysaccharide transport periplasmic protein LptA [Desulfuromonadales bacterium]
MKTLLILAICLCSAASAQAASQAAAPGRDRSGLPITIKSNELTADNKGKIAVFSGKVVAKQGDITIFADKIAVNYGEKKGEVEKIEATGNVRIVQQNRTGFAAQAVYNSRNGLIVLTGTPHVTQGSDSISGKIITYYVDRDVSIVSGGGDSRVEAVINPPDRKVNADGR